MLELDALRADDRAIEGLPIRLVIAFVVGIAALSLMLNMVSGLGGLTVSEVTVEPTPDVIGPESTDVTLSVVDASGDPVGGATVVVQSGSARLDELATAETDANGTATVTVDPDLSVNQLEGTLEIDVKPPAGGGYADDRDNPPILVLREN